MSSTQETSHTLLAAVTTGVSELLVRYIFPEIVELSLKKKGTPITLADLTTLLNSSQFHPPIANGTAAPAAKAKKALPAGTKGCIYQTSRGKNPGQKCDVACAEGYDYCNGCLKKSSVRREVGLPPLAKGAAKAKAEPAAPKAPVANIEALVAAPKAEEENLAADFFGPEEQGFFILNDIGFIGKTDTETSSQYIYAKLDENKKLCILTESDKATVSSFRMSLVDDGLNRLKEALGKEVEQYL